MTKFAATLLLALPFTVALAPYAVDPIRTIDVTLSRYAISPERIEVRRGERVRLNVELTPTEVGTFEITCSEDCGSGHGRMKAWLIVTPDR